MTKGKMFIWLWMALAIAALTTPMAMAAVAPHYFSVPNYANSPLPTVTPGACSGTSATACATDANCPTGETCQGAIISGGIRKFVNTLAGLNSAGANDLGQYIPVAIADINTYPGSDYYEIAVVQYREKMHSDLPPTLLRGYVQLETPANAAASKHVPLVNANMDGSTTPILLNGNPVYAVDSPHYLGPLVSATKDKPVRILFRNLLPTGLAGNLFIPVDTTVMGAGMGPGMSGMAEMDPQNPMCGDIPKPMSCFTENRATLHLHGGISPWISDGTPHQWVTPANENTPYPKGVSVYNVPDMPDPGPGAMTFFYTNQQSARLMFYHDHAWGITRLNVYAGEAAPYVISDPAEQSLISQGIIPGPADTIPLVIQDKTFVPSQAALDIQDPNWDSSRWGGFGDLWVPHVYVPAQNPGDSSGVNQFGRWAYGPWFWPPTSAIDFGPIANPYFDADCNSDVQWCEPPMIPGVPFVSMGMEAFNDTPMVNGTVYPTVTVQPKSYRLRILNAANDRFWNLSFYKADASGTEVALNPAEVADALIDTTIFPTPVPGMEGPSWVQIGTEGGFLPAPAVIPPQYTTWVNDPTVFNAGNVDKHSLLLGPAERADVIVDFSAYAGQTLILYNDAPAAFPARDPRYDYYTGNADLTETGGAPSTLPGYGPNIRTIMQIKIAAAPVAPAFNLNQLQMAFNATSLGGQGVFEASQNPIVVGQGAYNSAYGTNFRNNAPLDGFARITDFSLTFRTLFGHETNQTLTMPFKTKAIQDEMGEAFDHEYGRMSGNLGLEVPLTQAGTQQNLILYPYANPASEVFDGIELPPGVSVTPISSADDGSQIWKITHNGVDTHPIHFHLYDVQLLNRVGWDGIIRRPDANELGWKDTVRVSPLEDTIFAMRPFIPKMSFGLPDSIRPLNPMMPIGSTVGFNNTDELANPISPPISNVMTNFGWEYVWHCHILSHEEMDMMRPVSVMVARELPGSPVLSASGIGPVNLAWIDATPAASASTPGNPGNEIGFRVERARVTNGVTGVFSQIGTALANATAYVDAPAVNAIYAYRVYAYNAAGNSPFSNTVMVTVGTLSPVAGVSPASLVFGNQQINTTSSSQTVTLSNAGNAALAISSIGLAGANAGDFTQTNTCSASLAAGANCTISVSFRPTAIGARTASLAIGSNDPVNPMLSVSLSGTGTAAVGLAMEVQVWADAGTTGASITSPAFSTTSGNQLLLAFIGAANPSTTAPATTVTGVTGGGLTWELVRRTNVQRGTAEIWRAFAATPLAGSTVTATLNQSVSSRSITVVSYTGVDTTGTNGSGAIGATGSGNALSGPPTASLVTTRANSWVFGVGNDWDGATARTLGTGQTMVHQFLSTATGDTYWTQRRTSVTPAAGTAVTINDTAPTNHRYNLSIVEVRGPGATAGPAVAEVSPTALAFGSQPLNTISATGAVTLSNTGSSALLINSIGFTGANAGDFLQSTGTCGASLAAGTNCTINVHFRPTVIGPRVASLVINSNDSVNPSLSVSLSGTGTIAPAGLAIDATVSADSSTTGASISSPVFSTTSPNELLLAFVAASNPSTSAPATTVTSVTGGGLTWVLVQRTNTQRGTAEIWRAFATAPLTGSTVTAALNQSVSARSITVVSFTGTDTTGTNGSGAIGATGSGNALAGAPTASLVTTRANSLVFGVGNDWDDNTTRTLGAGQTMVHQYLSVATDDTFWVQRRSTTTPAAGTTVTINDTAPATDRYNLSIVEVRTP